MKRYLLSAGVALSLVTSLFAHEANIQQIPSYDDQIQNGMAQPKDWREQVLDQEGNIEFGGEWLYLSSSLTPTITKEQIRVGSFNTDRLRLHFEKHVRKSINPEYNSGFTAFIRLRPCTNNDMTFKYHYLHNNGDGRLNRNDRYQGIDDEGDTIIQTTRQDDKGHIHHHMHIGDFMVGRGLPLARQMLLRLAGGLTYNDFHMTFERSDNDANRIQNLTQDRDEETVTQEFYREKRRFWGLGPKGEIDFEFAMLPLEWEHSLNFIFWGQVALLYSKEWAHGHFSNNELGFEEGDFNYLIQQDYPWRWGSTFHLIPNINLDFGLIYRIETSTGYALTIGGGYRVYTYWNLKEMFAPLTEFSAEDGQITEDYNRNNDKLIYAGPYVKVSFAF